VALRGRDEDSGGPPTSHLQRVPGLQAEASEDNGVDPDHAPPSIECRAMQRGGKFNLGVVHAGIVTRYQFPMGN
jgi:hypothetical protein